MHPKSLNTCLAAITSAILFHATSRFITSLTVEHLHPLMHASLQDWLAVVMHAHAKAMSSVASVSSSSKKMALNLCCWNMPRSVQPGFANMCDVKPTLLHTLLALRSICEAWIWKRNISIETLPFSAMTERGPWTLTRHFYACCVFIFQQAMEPFLFLWCEV